MVVKNELAMSINVLSLGRIISCTVGFAEAISAVTLLGNPSGRPPCSCSIFCTSSSYTLSGLICRFRSLCSSKLLILSDSTDFRYDWPGPRRVYVVIIRDTGVLARSNEVNSVVVSNWAASTFCFFRGGEISTLWWQKKVHLTSLYGTWNMVSNKCSSRLSYWLP